MWYARPRYRREGLMSERTPLSNTIQAFSLILAMLAEELENSGALSRPAFAKKLRDMVAEAEATAPEHLKGADRLDLRIGLHVADLMSGPTSPSGKAWTPVVIQGG